MKNIWTMLVRIGVLLLMAIGALVGIFAILVILILAAMIDALSGENELFNDVVDGLLDEL